MANVDALDQKLIRLLEQDARRSSEAVAKELDVSPATVRRRLRNLIRKGVIRVAAIPDPGKVGLPLTVIMALKVNHQKLDSIMVDLTKRREVSWICTTTGRFDILMMVRFHSTEELAKFVQSGMPKVQGIEDTETFVCLDWKQP